VSGLRFTDEQRAAIDAREGDWLLAASAGSGKTSVLVERYVRTACEDGVEIRRILAITFTEKAAAELGGRIRAELLRRGETERARETEGGAIGTIHGLCARVLRADPLRAGIDPRFVVLEQAGADRLAAEAFGAALDAYLAGGSDAARDLVAAYTAETLRLTVIAAHGELRSRGVAPALPPPGPRPSPFDLVAELEAAARAAAAELGAASDPGKGVLNALDALDACSRRLAELTSDEVPLPALWADTTMGNGGGKLLATDACERYRRAQQAFVDACADQHALGAYAEIDALLSEFARTYEQMKAQRSVLDFSDLELATRDLLLSHEDVRARVAARYERIMVDEFQDTNPLQLELLGLIARDNLFTVGDEFQSIYGFRHTDVQLFRDRRAALEPTGRVRTLRTNFRSRPELIEVLNGAFTPVFGEGFAPLVAGREDWRADPADAPPRVELLVTACDADWASVDLVAPGTPPPAQPWRAAEARLLAQRVREEIDSGEHGAGDIVVLFRATGDIALFERALEDQGVPTYVIGGRGYWAHREVQDLLAHLSLLANPRDELRLYEVLASPLAEVSSDGMVLLGAAARERGRDPYSVLAEGALPDGLSAPDRERLEEWTTWFRGERTAAAHRSLEELIDRALTHRGFDLAVLRAPGGRRRLANVRKLMRLAREWERDEGGGLRGFLDAAGERAGEDLEASREGDAPVESENLDAVRLMTIHAAKGLEFPVVCVADLGRQPPAGGQEVLRLGRAGGVGLKLATLDGSKRRPALDWHDVGVAADEAAWEEEERLFYVAMTRAQHRLILSGAMKAKAWDERRRTSPPLQWIGPAFVPEIATHARAAPGEEPAGVDGRVAWAINHPDHVGAVLRPESLAPVPGEEAGGSEAATGGLAVVDVPDAAPALPPLSYSRLERYALCSYRFYLEDVLRLPPTELRGHAPGAAGLELAANVRGSIVHTLLEHVDFADPRPPAEAELAAAFEEHGAAAPRDDERADVLGLVAGFAGSPVRARLAAASDVAREQRFAFELDPALVMGAFDAVGRELDGTVLVADYKTNRLEGRAPAEIVEAEYRVQRLVYALAALRAGAGRVETVFLFLEAPDAAVSAIHAQADATRLESELRELTRGVESAAYRVSREPGPELCNGCPGRGTLCTWPWDATERPAPVSTGGQPVLPGFAEAG
jgi:ATP-dependent exoDNAse (exonuclease V) beta subunit